MNKRFAALIITLSVALGLVPWLCALVLNHGPLGVPPEFANDSEYYYAQLHDVALGYPFIGNPYYKEYVNEPATSFFGADWIAAAPLVAGIPIVPAIALDFAAAFGVFAALLVLLGIRLGMRRWWIVSLVSAALAVSYWLMERPVSMQVVFPCFVFFLLSYLAWLQHPESHGARIAFIISSALAFYVYTYLWQIVVIVFGLTHLFFLLYERRRIVSILWIDAATLVLSLPVIWYTYMQVHQPWYWQTITRTGFVETHTVGSSGIVVALITAFMLGALWALCSDRRQKRHELLFFAITGFGILIASFSNVITGKDLETAIHLIRFTYVWAAIAGVYALWLYFSAQRERTLFSRSSIFVAGIALFFLFFSYQTPQGFPSLLTSGTVATQAYAAPLAWLNENTPPGSVIFADDDFSYYVPVMTRDYVLFQPDGGLYLMPDSEVQNRYLASRIFDDLSLTDIENDLRLYAGAGNADDGPETLDRGAKICMLFKRSGCPPLVSGVSYMGLPYFTGLYQRYQNVLADPEAALAPYDVSYIVKDTTLDPHMNLASLPDVHLVATVGRFEIYSFDATGTAPLP